MTTAIGPDGQPLSFGDLCPIHAGTISREEARAEMDVKARLDSADYKLQEWALSSNHDCNKVTDKAAAKVTTKLDC